MNNLIDELYMALISCDDDKVDECLNEIAQMEDSASVLLDVFKDDDDFLHEFHMIIHLIDQLPPRQLYKAMTEKLVVLKWRTPYWASYIVNRVLNGVRNDSCGIDYEEFLQFVASHGSEAVKACLLEISKNLKGKLTTDAAELATKLL